jgi:hypothetical protein
MYIGRCQDASLFYPNGDSNTCDARRPVSFFDLCEKFWKSGFGEAEFIMLLKHIDSPMMVHPSF